MTTFDQLMYGIGVQESGGHNYSVVNSIGAVGKYQVMKGNIPNWSRQVLGYSISWQQFRDSPKLQEQIVRGILKGYYNKYGARGAAAAWYAGPGNHNLDQSTHSQFGGPSIKSYVDSVLNHASKFSGSSSGSSSGGGGGSSGSTGGNQVPMSKGETAESYGYVQSLFDAVPELKNLFGKAVKGQWSAGKFQASIRDTRWWKTHSQQERDYLTKTYGDPATAKQQFSSAYIHVQQLAGTLGIQGSDQTKKLLNAWAYNVAAKGWTDDQLRYEMGKHVYFDHGTWNGQGGEEQAKLHDYAYSMGVTMSNTWYSGASRNIVRGVRAEQDFMSDIRKQAKSLFPHWAKQIDAGHTVADLANPYLTSMQQILELPGGSINLFDPTVKKALQYKDPKTGQGTAKPLWQFENELRGDPRWKKTKNAQDSLMQVAHQVLSDFGLKY
jgi:hypothetical protein